MTRCPPPEPPTRRLRAILLVIAILALLGPALVVLAAPRRHVPLVTQLIPRARVVPRDMLPPVEEVRFIDMTPDEARTYNAGVPFVRGPNPAARPFILRDDAENIARATDCLAAAVLYEAGSDPDGQRAVAQVVLNRVRHPAFPKSVCGVVFEGQERRTGCQFTFTCDGALDRWSPPPDMWVSARKVAAAALSGAVYRPVGYATHYHTDWVVPYWQASLDKIAAVHSHLFFRWSGWWGTPPAFSRRVESTEPSIERLAAMSDAHRSGSAFDEAEAAFVEALAAAGQLPASNAPTAAADGEDGVFLVALPKSDPDLFPAMAAMTCGGAPYCKYLGWADPKSVPASSTLDPSQIASMGFSYLRDRSTGIERTLWNCTLFPRTQPSQCMRRQAAVPPPPKPASLPAAASAPAGRAGELAGVRRAPGPTPTPAPRAGTTAPLARLHVTDEAKEPR